MRNMQITDYTQLAGTTTKVGLSSAGVAYPSAESTNPTVNDWLPSFISFLPGVRLPFQLATMAATNGQIQEAAGAINTSAAPMAAHAAGAAVVRWQDRGRRWLMPIVASLRNPQW